MFRAGRRAGSRLRHVPGCGRQRAAGPVRQAGGDPRDALVGGRSGGSESAGRAAAGGGGGGGSERYLWVPGRGPGAAAAPQAEWRVDGSAGGETLAGPGLLDAVLPPGRLRPRLPPGHRVPRAQRFAL